jgi:hypothetical protein
MNANLQLANVQLPSPLFLNRSYRLTLLCGYNSRQLTGSSLQIFHLVIRLLVLPHVSERSLRAITRTYSLKVCPSAPHATSAMTDCVEKMRVAQSASFWTTSYLKYLTSIERITTTTSALYPFGNGTSLCMYVKDGDNSYFHHHTASISKFFARTELLSGRISASGQHFLSFSNL